MLRTETGNLVTGNYPIFCQQVNCKGVMGAGLAKQIRNVYPEVYNEYKYVCNNGDAYLGNIQLVETNDDRICVNMFAQYSYGRNDRYTNYEAFMKCLLELEQFVTSYAATVKMNMTENKVVAFPMYIGCGLAGGDWNKILSMLKGFSERIPWDVVLVKLKRD